MAISTPLPRTAIRVDATVLGYAGILGSPLLAFGMMALDAGQPALGDGLMLSFLLGWMGSMIALYRTNALGTGPWGRTGLTLQMIVLSIAILWQATQAYHHDIGKGSLWFTIGDLCWPVSVNGMTLVGIGVLAAKRWTGFRRFTPLACGLCFPIGMAALALFGPSWSTLFALLTSYAWSALGLAAVLEARRQQAAELNAAS